MEYVDENDARQNNYMHMKTIFFWCNTDENDMMMRNDIC